MDTSEKVQKEIINQNYEILQAITWHQNIRFGRGILLFNYEDIVGKNCHSDKTVWNIPYQQQIFKAIYLHRKNSTFERIFKSEQEGIAFEVCFYDPGIKSFTAFYKKDSKQLLLYPLDDAVKTPFKCHGNIFWKHLEPPHLRSNLRFEDYTNDLLESDDRNLKLSKDRAAALELLDIMEYFSEKCYCAGWQIDWEYLLQDKINQNKTHAKIRVGTEILDRSLFVKLEELSQQAGGWWIWDRKYLEVVFIPSSDWLHKYETHSW